MKGVGESRSRSSSDLQTRHSVYDMALGQGVPLRASPTSADFWPIKHTCRRARVLQVWAGAGRGLPALASPKRCTNRARVVSFAASLCCRLTSRSFHRHTPDHRLSRGPFLADTRIDLQTLNTRPVPTSLDRLIIIAVIVTFACLTRHALELPTAAKSYLCIYFSSLLATTALSTASWRLVRTTEL